MTKEEFLKLKKKFEDLQLKLAEVQARRELLKKEAEELRLLILTKTKLESMEEVPALIDKIEKEIELKNSEFSTKVAELEQFVLTIGDTSKDD